MLGCWTSTFQPLTRVKLGNNNTLARLAGLWSQGEGSALEAPPKYFWDGVVWPRLKIVIVSKNNFFCYKALHAHSTSGGSEAVPSQMNVQGGCLRVKELLSLPLAPIWGISNPHWREKWDGRRDLLGTNFTLRHIVWEKSHTASGSKPGLENTLHHSSSIYSEREGLPRNKKAVTKALPTETSTQPWLWDVVDITSFYSSHASGWQRPFWPPSTFWWSPRVGF